MGEGRIVKSVIKRIKKWKKVAIVVVILIPLLASVFFWGTAEVTTKKVSKEFKEVLDNIEIKDKNLVINEEYLENAKDNLKKWRIDANTLGLERK